MAILRRGRIPTGMLASTVPSIKQIRTERYRESRTTRLQRCRHARRRCSVSAAFGIAASIPIAVILIGLLAHLVGAPTSTCDRENLPGMFLSMGEVLGAVAGLLFAVLVFAVEFQIGRAGELAPLTKFLHRSSGMIPDAAVVVGVIATSVFLAFWIGNGFWGHGNSFEFMLVALFAVALALTFGHFCRVIRESTGNLFDQMQEAMLPYIDDIGDEDAVARGLVEAFEHLCADSGIEIKRFGFLGSWLTRDKQIEFSLDATGVVSDIHTRTFRLMAEQLRSRCSRFKPYVCLIPTDRTRLGPLLVLEPREQADLAVPEAIGQQTEPAADDEPPLVLSDEDRLLIHGLLQRAVQVHPRSESPARDLGAAVNVLLQACKQAAKDANATMLKQHFDVVESLVAEWSRSRGSSAAMFALAEDGPRFFPTTIGSSLSPIVHAAIESGNDDVVDAVEAFLHHLVHAAESSGEKDLATEAIRLLVAMYPITLSKCGESA